MLELQPAERVNVLVTDDESTCRRPPEARVAVAGGRLKVEQNVAHPEKGQGLLHAVDVGARHMAHASLISVGCVWP